MKQVLLLISLSFLLTNMGCRTKIPIRVCPIITSRAYFRYINNNAPPSSHPVNKDRFASTEYKKAKKTVIKLKPLTNLKEEDERSPETYPGLYYSGDDNLDYSEYLKLRK